MSELDQIATALAAAQAQMSNAIFNRVNPHFKSKYADMPAIRDASVPALSKNGLSVTQFTRYANGELVLHTILMHKSGQYLEGTFPIIIGSPQAMGSQLTYGRRYGWAGIVGISADDDDDANAAESIGGLQNVEKKSAYRARKDKDWETLKAGIDLQDTVAALKEWGRLKETQISQMPDNWQNFLREAYVLRMAALRDGVTEEGQPFEPGSVEPEEEAKP